MVLSATPGSSYTSTRGSSGVFGLVGYRPEISLKAYLGYVFKVFVLHYIYGRVWAIPTYRVYRLYGNCYKILLGVLLIPCTVDQLACSSGFNNIMQYITFVSYLG